MNPDRRQVLDMLAQGKITAEEADRLLAALEKTPGPASEATSQVAARPARAKYLRVMVEADHTRRGGPAKINIRVPMQLVRAGVRLSTLLPPEARDRVNAAMAQKGMAFDLNQIRPEDLEAVVEELNDITLNVDHDRARVRIFCE